MALAKLVDACARACSELVPLVTAVYHGKDRGVLKEDKSVFTIADGLVQAILTEQLLVPAGITVVGEENVKVNMVTTPYTVGDLVVPDELVGAIDTARSNIGAIGKTLEAYPMLTAFVDPIDGTREFTTGKGEQCTTCIGFAREGRAVAGVVYRPLTSVWVGGAKEEGYAVGNIVRETPSAPGLLTTNGSISPFLVALMDQAKAARVPSGGAGNKMMMLLEGKGTMYIQDRGLSRWDTCAAEAAIEAHGGVLCKLSPFVKEGKLDRYMYRESATNLDFVPREANLTRYNAADPSKVPSDKVVAVESVDQVKPYSNLCGVLAVPSPEALDDIKKVLDAAQKIAEPSYD